MDIFDYIHRRRWLGRLRGGLAERPQRRSRNTFAS